MARPRKHTDEELLAVARAVFIAHGPAVSMSVIAEQVGLSQPALSKRFGSKETLMVRALLPEPIDAWADMLDAGPDAGRSVARPDPPSGGRNPL